MNSYGKLMLAASLGLTSGPLLATEVVSYFNNVSAIKQYNAQAELKVLNGVTQSEQQPLSGQQMAQHVGRYFSAQSSGDLRVLANTLQADNRFISYQQTYQGLDVWERQLVVVVDKNGQIEQGYGSLAHNISKDLAKVVMPSQAQKQAGLERFVDTHFSQNDRIFRNKAVEAVIYIDKDNKSRLAYKFSFFTDVKNGKSHPQKILAFVDVANDELLAQHDVLHRAHSANANLVQRQAVGGAGPSGNIKQPWPDYVASGAQNTPPTTFIVEQEVGQNGSTCYFEALNVETRDYNHGITAVNQPFSYDCTTSTENRHETYNTAKSPLNDAHRNAQVTRQMYLDYLGQEPLFGAKIIQNVHYGQYMDQAFYESGQVYYGDGDFLFYPMVALDVVAHEIAHGFTEEYGTSSSKVMLTGQARAINEAFSDISGAAAEFYLRGTNDWQSNFESYVPAGEALRYMDDPKKDNSSIDHIDQYESTTEAHHGAGIFNKAFHRLVTMDMGNSQANPWDTKHAFILFANANKNCWIATSTYQHAADCVMRQASSVKDRLNAAKGTNWTTAELKNHVRKSFAQVGVKLQSDVGLESDFSFGRSFLTLSFDADSRWAGQEISTLNNANEYQWHWDFGHDNATSNAANPTHTFPATGEYKVSLKTTAPDGKSDTYSIYVNVADAYCPTQGLNFDKYYIQSVSINGVTTNSGGSGYTDNTNVPISVYNGGEFDVNIAAGLPDSSKDKTKNFYLYVDLNHDGLFDSSNELVYNGSSKTDVSTKLSLTGQQGQTFQARAMVSFSLLTKACGNFTWGEAEDYKITIDQDSAPPVINATATHGINMVTFNNTTNDARIKSWEWDFGDNSLPSHDKSTSHQYAKNGSYDVVLTAYDHSNQVIGSPWRETINFTTVTVPKFTPVVDGNKVTVDAVQSTMPVGSTVHWDFGDGSTTQLDSFTHTYHQDGNYDITLSISNPDGTESVTHQVQIGEPGYNPVFNHVVEVQSDGTFNVNFNNLSSTPENLHWFSKKASITWTFGDGQSEGPITTRDFGQDISHTYSAEGTFPVTLSISYKNSDGDIKTFTFTENVTLKSPDPVEYCQAVGFTDYEHIARVNFNNLGPLSNTTGSTDIVNPNNPIALTVGADNSYTITSGTAFSENYHVWIDFNQDGKFGDGNWRTDKTERVVAAFDHVQGTYDEGTGSVSGTFTLPESSFEPGKTITTRMRVMQYYSTTRTDSIDPCSNYATSGNGEGGEIEDYVVTITRQ